MIITYKIMGKRYFPTRPLDHSISVKVPGNKWMRELLCGEINLA